MRSAPVSTLCQQKPTPRVNEWRRLAPHSLLDRGAPASLMVPDTTTGDYFMPKTNDAALAAFIARKAEIDGKRPV